MAGIDGWLAQKYQIQGEQADAARRLSDAQAQNITASTPFENRLRAAQEFQTNQQGSTLAPLADASIAATHAGINETQARTGLFGAQTGLTGAQTQSTYDDLAAVPDGALSGLYRRLQQTYSPNGASSTSPVGGPTHFEGLSILTPPVSPKPVITAPGVGQNSNPADPNVIGGAQVQKYATGTDNVKPVPAPGQTGSNGTWTPPPPPFDPRAAVGIRGVPRPAPTPPVAYARGTSNVKPGASNQNVKVQGVQDVEMGPGYAKGKAKVPARGGAGGGKRMAPPMMAPQGMPMGTPPGAPAPGAGASPPNGLPGLAGMLQAAMGANQVPGRGMGDTVPAMLTPGEAVVNKGGIQHIPGGRQTIAAANAKGNAMKPSMGRGMVKKPGQNHVAVHIKMA